MKDATIWLVQLVNINGVGYVKVNMNMVIIKQENAMGILTKFTNQVLIQLILILIVIITIILILSLIINIILILIILYIIIIIVIIVSVSIIIIWKEEMYILNPMKNKKIVAAVYLVFLDVAYIKLIILNLILMDLKDLMHY